MNVREYKNIWYGSRIEPYLFCNSNQWRVIKRVLSLNKHEILGKKKWLSLWYFLYLSNYLSIKMSKTDVYEGDKFINFILLPCSGISEKLLFDIFIKLGTKKWHFTSWDDDFIELEKS